MRLLSEPHEANSCCLPAVKEIGTPKRSMTWWHAYRADIQRYVIYGHSGALKQALMQQGLWALFQYRIASSIFRSKTPSLIKRLLLIGCSLWQKLIEVLTGISLPYTAVIGPGLHISHFGPIIVNGHAVIGCNCNLSQGVTIGVSGRGSRRGVPVIGNRVYIGANVVVAGSISVGDDSAIGANSLVVSDVPANCTVGPSPAATISKKGSQDYLDPEQAS